jgi:stage V sporulation protein S
VSDSNVLRVSGGSNPQSVASALTHSILAGEQPHLRAIGASAVNQAVKACIIASGFLAPHGRTVSWRPGFDTVPGEKDAEISCITLRPVLDS